MIEVLAGLDAGVRGALLVGAWAGVSLLAVLALDALREWMD